MNPKAILAALAVAAGGVLMLFLYMQRFEDEASGGRPVQVLIATQDIPMGSAITQAMLGRRPLPEAYLEDRHIEEEDAPRILGVRVTNGVRAGESLLWSDLATTSDQSRDLSSLVRMGQRAITIRADVQNSLGGLVRPGDRVDVNLTMSTSASAEPVTITLLQNLLVLAAGQDTGAVQHGTTTRRSTIGDVTLGVSIEQSQVLAFAVDHGRVTLVLRNPLDVTVVENLPETTIRDIIEPQRRERVQRREQRSDTQADIPTRIGSGGR